MKIPEGFNLPNNANSKVDYSIKLNKSLLLIKAIKMYKYLLKERYLSLYFYVKISKNEFVIIVVYAYNINIVGTSNEFTKILEVQSFV